MCWSEQKGAGSYLEETKWLLYPTGPGSWCPDRGAQNLSLPGQILSWERRGGTGPGNHPALVLPAGRSQYTVTQPEGEGARMSRRCQGHTVGQQSVLHILMFTPLQRDLSSATKTSSNRWRMVFVEKAVCPDWQTSELAVRNGEVIHNIHGWWLRDTNLSAKGSCPSAGCEMSCAEGWQLPLDVSLCGAGEFHPGEQSVPRLYSKVHLLTKQPPGNWSTRKSQQLSSDGKTEEKGKPHSPACPRNSCPSV